MVVSSAPMLLRLHFTFSSAISGCNIFITFILLSFEDNLDSRTAILGVTERSAAILEHLNLKGSGGILWLWICLEEPAWELGQESLSSCLKVSFLISLTLSNVKLQEM